MLSCSLALSLPQSLHSQLLISTGQMAALAVKTLTPFSCARSAHRLICKAEKNFIEGLYGVSSRKTYYTESRRALLWKFVGLGAAILHVNSTLSAPLVDMKDPEIIRNLKLKSGVKIEEIVEGQGPEAHEGDIVEINYVCRRSNGYFVHSTVDQFSGESKPVVLSLDEKEVIQGLKDVLVGMKVGGKRRALIPPTLGYVNDSLKPIPDEFGPRRSILSHAKEPLVFEVQLLKLL